MLEHKQAHERRIRVYVAAPLFNEAERSFNVHLAERLEVVVEVFLPQRDGGLLSQMIAEGTDERVAACRVFKRDLEAILQADWLVAILDGRVIDEGVAFELGVAFAHAKRCVGIQPNSRRLAPWGNNPMITGAIEATFRNVDDFMEWFITEVHETPKNSVAAH